MIAFFRYQHSYSAVVWCPLAGHRAAGSRPLPGAAVAGRRQRAAERRVRPRSASRGDASESARALRAPVLASLLVRDCGRLLPKIFPDYEAVGLARLQNDCLIALTARYTGTLL